MTRNDEGMPGVIGSAEAERPGVPRRSVLAGAGAGVAGLAAATMLGGAAPALAGTSARTDSAAARTAAGTGGGEAREAIVAHVRDMGTGEIDLFRGTSHARIRDRQLAAQLARAIK
jgi:hypothetical protein